MAHFLAGLEKFKRWGPPSIENNPVSIEEDHLAKMLNIAEGDAVYEDLARVEKAEEYLEGLIDAQDTTDDSLKLQQIISTAQDSVNLAVCECNRLCSVLNQNKPILNNVRQSVGDVMFTDVEKISPSTKLKLLEDGGLNIE